MTWKQIESILAIASVSLIVLVVVGSVLVLVVGSYDVTPKYFRKRQTVVEANQAPETLKPQSNESGLQINPSPEPEATQQAQFARLESKSLDEAEDSPVVATESAPLPDAPAQRSETEELRIVLRSIETWQMAWQAQDIDAYIAQYTDTFQPANGRSHQAWLKDRQTKLTRAKAISIQIDRLNVQRLDNEHWKATFHQRYQSATYADEVNKELRLIKSGNQYLITEERVTPKTELQPEAAKTSQGKEPVSPEPLPQGG